MSGKTPTPETSTANKAPVKPAAPQVEGMLDLALPGGTTGVMDRLTADPRALSSREVLQLQRKVGNRSVTQLLIPRGAHSIQTKLTVGAAHDEYEQEADEVAEQVMRMPASTFSPPASGEDDSRDGQPAIQRTAAEDEELQAKPLAATITPLVQRELAPEEDELQTKRVSAADSFDTSTGFESRVQASRGNGTSLPADVRAFMEPRFEADFSSVRIHSNSEAAQLNREVSAQAFTHGSDIYLGDGKTDLSSNSGKQLLAHELTHVVQQGGANQLRRAPEDEDEDELVQVNVETPSSHTAQAGETTATPQAEKSQKDGNQSAAVSAPGAAPDDKLAQQPPAFGQTTLDKKPPHQGMHSTHEMPEESAFNQAHPQHAANTRQPAAAQATAPDQLATTSSQQTDQTAHEQAHKPVEAEREDQLKPQDAPSTKPKQAQQKSDKKPDSKSKKPTADKGQKATKPSGKPEQAEAPEAVAAAAQEPAPAEMNGEAINQPAQVDVGLVQEVDEKAKTAETQKQASDQLVQQTTEQLAALNGAEAIIPEDLWQSLELDKKDIAAPAESFAAQSPQTDQAEELLIQLSPDPNAGHKLTQAPPQHISVPNISIDTAPIVQAAQTAKTGAGFEAKLLQLPLAVTAAQKTVEDAYTLALGKLDAQLPTTLADLDADAQKAQDDITAKFDTATKSLDTLQQGIDQRVDKVIDTACQKVDTTVATYVAKCEPDARNAIQSYCATEGSKPDDGTLPLLGGRGEEAGYHARKAAAALDAAIKVGLAYADEYRKQGEDTKAAFQGQVRNDFVKMMQDEIAGMRTTLEQTKTGAFTQIDQTKETLVQQATDLHAQSVQTLEAAHTSTLQDLTAYQSKLTTELTNAQTSFNQQIQSSANTAVSQAQAALASAQAALAAVIQQASGPDRAFKPGAQQAIDQAAANIQSQLQQQIAEAVAQINQQGTQMAGTVNALDVQTGSAAYATTFTTTTTNMLTQVIDQGLVAIHTNMVTYGTEMTTQTETSFNDGLQAVAGSLQQIEDGGKQNLPAFVDTQFKPGLDTAHQKLASQAAAEGAKAGNATLPRWKEVLKVIVSIAIAVVIAVVIIAVVAATGGVAGIILGALVGAAIGALGGAAKCLFNNWMDGKQNIWENVGREAILGAISGALSGLTAGVLGVAFQGTLTVGQMFMKEGIDAVASALKDGVVEAISQSVKYNGKVDWLSVLGTVGESLVINLVTAGIFKGPGIYKAAQAAKGTTTALESAAEQVDNGLREGVEQVPEGATWGRPPRTPSELKAQELGWPEPQPGYRWNMSKSGVPYQQRMPGMKGALPEPPKFTLPEGQVVPTGLPNAVPTVSPTANAPVAPPGATWWTKTKDALPLNPFASTDTWKNWQVGKSGMKEGLKYGYNQVTFGYDNWNTAKENAYISHQHPDGINTPPPGVNWPTSTTNVPPGGNVAVPSAPHYDPKDWNFGSGTAVPAVNVPVAPTGVDFDAGVDQNDVLDDISEQRP